MLYATAVVLLVLWLLGLFTAYTMGGFIHIFLAVALMFSFVNIITSRRKLS